MPDLDTSEQEEIAQDECLGNKACSQGNFISKSP